MSYEVWPIFAGTVATLLSACGQVALRWYGPRACKNTVLRSAVSLACWRSRRHIAELSPTFCLKIDYSRVSTCQVSMTNFVCMNFDCRPTCVRPHINFLSTIGVSSVNESSRRVRRATHLRSIVETIQVETHFIHLPYSRPYTYAGPPSHFF